MHALLSYLWSSLTTITTIAFQACLTLLPVVYMLCLCTKVLIYQAS